MRIPRCLRTTALAVSLVSVPLAVQAEVFSYGDFYEDTVTASCTNVYSCRIDFSKTPAGRILTIRRAACFIERSLPLRLVAMGAANQLAGVTSRFMPLPFAVNTTGNGSNYYSINQDVLYLVRPGRFPFIVADTTAPSTTDMTCTITGTLSNK